MQGAANAGDRAASSPDRGSSSSGEQQPLWRAPAPLLESRARVRCWCTKRETEQVGRHRRAKRQRRTQQRLPVLPILDEADLDTPVSPQVGPESSHLVYCPRCTGVLGMLLVGEEGVHLWGCAVGFVVSCDFCRWPVSPRLMPEPKWERHYGAFWDYYDRVVCWPRYAAATDTQDSPPEIS